MPNIDRNDENATRYETPASGKAEGGDARELLPCPFCGHVGVIVGPGTTLRWRVAECESCGAHTGEVRCQTSGEPRDVEKWEAQAITDAHAEWNRRAHLATAAANGPGELPSEPHTVKKLRQWRDEGMNVHNDPSIVNYIDALLGIIATISTPQPGMVTVPRTEAEEDELWRKAKRYDWLREGNSYIAIIDSPSEKTPDGQPVKITAYNKEPVTGDALDQAIDAALRSGRRET